MVQITNFFSNPTTIVAKYGENKTLAFPRKINMREDSCDLKATICRRKEEQVARTASKQ